jgi:hypothetical protein
MCIEYLSSEHGRKHLDEEDFDDESRWNTVSKDICVNIVERLLKKESPFCSRTCFIWQGDPGETEQREPDFQGAFLNASLTHLGCIEVIKVDENQNPTEVDFLPFDEIQGVIFAQPSLFRAAKIFYDHEKKDEIVFVPILYGLSWLSGNQFDHDGSMTRFCCHIETKTGINLGIGLGQQDFTITDSNGNQSIFGMSSVGEIMVGLEITDPKFEVKCKARGLDPHKVKEHMKA